MSFKVRELETQRDNALALVKYLDEQIASLGKPKKKPDRKVAAARQEAERMCLRKFG